MATKLKAVLKGLSAVFALLLAALLTVGALQRADVQIPTGVRGNHVVIDGVPIRYTQTGDGPDVLLLHGSPGSVEDWEPIVARLADRFHVTAFDRPGHGYSGGAELPHTPQENARITLALIRSLGLRDVVLVGHSYGGLTGLALAMQNPSELRALVVVGSRGYGPMTVAPLYRLLAVPVLGSGVAALAAPWLGPSQIEAGIRASFGPNVDLIPAGFVARRIQIWNRPTVTTSLSRERATFPAVLDALAPRYAEIRKPVFLVYGEQDLNYAGAQRLAREISGAELLSLANTGHYVQYARPDELARIIERAAAR